MSSSVPLFPCLFCPGVTVRLLLQAFWGPLKLLPLVAHPPGSPGTRAQLHRASLLPGHFHFQWAPGLPGWQLSLGTRVRRSGSVTSFPTALIAFPLGGPRPVPGNRVIPTAHGKGRR